VTLYSREYWYSNEDYNCVFNFSEQFTGRYKCTKYTYCILISYV